MLAVNAPLYPERLLDFDPTPQAEIPLATVGVQRYVWESRFGTILIEVIGDKTFVNGQAVEPIEARGSGTEPERTGSS